MVFSMTGFATATYELHPDPNTLVYITMTIKTLNSRFFEVTCRLPHLLAPLEQSIVQRCKETLKRGNVTVTVHISNPSAFQTKVMPAFTLAEGYLTAIKAVQEKYRIPGELTIRDILMLPGIFEANDVLLDDTLSNQLLTYTTELLDTVVASRATEGKALQEDLENSVQIIGSCVEELAPRAAIVSEQRRDRFLQELNTALAQAPQEVRDAHIQALYQNITMIDTHEEIVRLRTHQRVFLDTLHDVEMQKGKKLDFILQELLREINTLNAKLADATSIGWVLTIKTKLEQAREQVQNIV